MNHFQASAPRGFAKDGGKGVKIGKGKINVCGRSVHISFFNHAHTRAGRHAHTHLFLTGVESSAHVHTPARARASARSKRGGEGKKESQRKLCDVIHGHLELFEYFYLGRG